VELQGLVMLQKKSWAFQIFAAKGKNKTLLSYALKEADENYIRNAGIRVEIICVY